MPLSGANSVAVQLEKVRSKLPLLYERDDTFFSLIQKRDVEAISTRAMRIPLQIRPGGRPGAANFDGGDLGRGSATDYDVATISPVDIRFAVEIQKRAEYAVNSREKAIENVVKNEVANAMKELRTHIDCWLQTAGAGVLASVASTAGVTFTVDNAPFGAQLLRPGQRVQAMVAAQTSYRTGVMTIASISGNVVTVDALSTGLVATDVIVPDGLTATPPVWMFGIPYHHNTATTGSWQGLTRSSVSEILANGVDAGAALLTLPPLRLALNKIRQRVGVSNLGQLRVHLHPAQHAAYEELGIVISEIQKGGGNEDFDLLFGKGRIAGFPVVENIHAAKNRLDFINLGVWGRGELKAIDFYEEGGQTTFPVYGTSGGIAAAYLFYYVTSCQFFTDNPAGLSSVTNLAVPSGY